MLKILFSGLLFTAVLSAYSRDFTKKFPEIKASVGSYISSGKDLPFWITSNQNGVFAFHNSDCQLLQFGFEQQMKRDTLKNWNLFYGSNIVYGFSGVNSDFQFNQYWIGARYKRVILKAGAQPEPVLYGGLSSTNGSMDWSNNSRPLPGLTFSTDGFVPFVWWKKWFTFKALYSENLLYDKRFVDKVHLHHKYVIGKASFKNVKLSLGLDHWVYWGGISPVYGSLQGLSSYFRYILALKGGSTAPKNERSNVLGNSLGQYMITAEKDFRNFRITFYYNHPFEDMSGMEMQNIPDGLWGIHYNLNHKSLLSDFVYEFMNTNNQSGTYNMVEIEHTGRFTGRGNDNYFNNFIYKSGHVFHNRMMGSPLFLPVIDQNGISRGFDNTRIVMHHTGLSGWFNERLNWKSLLTWWRSFGTYDPEGVRFDPPLSEISCLAQCGYVFKNLPLSLNVGVAGDYGKRFEKRTGVYATLNWTFK